MEMQELRIGNWIIEPGQDDNKPFQIFSIYHEKGNNKVNGLPIALMQPIPLTEEWLVKFGFELRIKRHFQKESMTITNYGHEGIYEDKNFIELKYVHQLQNLYFALTNMELTLKK